MAKDQYASTRTFLTKVLQNAKEKIPYSISNLARELKIPHATIMTTVLIKQKFIKKLEKVGRGVIYSCSFNTEKIADDNTFIRTIHAACQKYNKDCTAIREQSGTVKTVKVPKVKNGLLDHVLPHEMTDATLLRELRRRGYQGTLEKIQKIKIG